MFTEDEMRAYIRRQSGCYNSQKEMADAMGIHESLLSRILKGERPINDHIAEFFGRKRVVLFVIPVEEKETEIE